MFVDNTPSFLLHETDAEVLTPMQRYEIEIKTNQSLTCNKMCRLIPKLWYFILMLFLVYFEEYCIITGFAQVMRQQQDNIYFDAVEKPANIYNIINTSY